MEFDLREVHWRDHGDEINAFRRRILEEGEAGDGQGVFRPDLDRKRSTRHLTAWEGGELAATLRLHEVETDEPVAAPELERIPSEARILAISAFMVAPEHRHTDLALDMFRAMYRRARSLGADVVIAAVAPHLVMMYEALGFFRYGPGFMMDDEAFRVPMMLNLHDVLYMRRMGSALTPLAQRYDNPDPYGEAILVALSDIAPETRPPRRSMLASTLMTDDSRANLGPMLTEGLDDDAVKRLFEHTQVQDLQPGAALIRAGEEDDTLYVLLDGNLGVVPEGETQPVTYIQQGEVVGETALVRGGRTRPATIVALSDSRVLALGQEDLQKLTREEPEIAARFLLNLAGAMAERLARTTRMLLGEK
ncbi:MAG: GNAT family N-acetyltransferase [Myxococcota bacterium]